MASSASVRRVALAFGTIALLVLVALAGLVFWSGSGFLENPGPAGNEWLTVTESEFEIRGTVFGTQEALAAGLAQLRPKPQFVSIRWAAGSGASKLNPSRVQQARDALAHAKIPMPVNGLEVESSSSRSSGSSFDR